VSHNCVICGGGIRGPPIIAREMMFGLNDQFEYYQCEQCGTLQIGALPVSMDKYYPSGYHLPLPSRFLLPIDLAGCTLSIMKRVTRALHVPESDLPLAASFFAIIDSKLVFAPKHGKLWNYMNCGMIEEMLGFIGNLDGERRSRILDVGCGPGYQLRILRALGFDRLVGIDPFLDATVSQPGLVLRRESLFELSGHFDIVFFNHSFEHMPSPRSVLRKASSMLCEGGKCLIRTPVVPCHSWRLYRENWVQLDPPRHLFVPSVRGLQELAHGCALRVYRVDYDSTDLQFWGSEQNARGIPLKSTSSFLLSPRDSIFGARQIEVYKRMAADLNLRGDGDQAAIYLVKE